MSAYRRGTALLVLGTLMLMLVAGCAAGTQPGPSAAQSPTGQPAGLKPAGQSSAASSPTAAPMKATSVKVALPTLASLSYLAEFFAQEKGFFKDAGLEVSIEKADNDVSLAALRSGEVFASGSTSQAIQAASEGFPVVLVLATTKYAPWSFFVTSDINSFKELKGKAVGVSGTQSITKDITDELLRKNGMTLQDVQMLVTGSMGNQMAALKGGSVKAAVLSVPSDVTARASGFKTLAGPSEMPPSIPGGAAVGTAYAAKNPAVVRAYVGSVVRSIRYLVDPKNTDEAVKFIAKQFQLEEKVVSEIWGYFKESLSTDGTVPDETVQMELKRAGKDVAALPKVRDWSYARAAMTAR